MLGKFRALDKQSKRNISYNEIKSMTQENWKLKLGNSVWIQDPIKKLSETCAGRVEVASHFLTILTRSVALLWRNHMDLLKIPKHNIPKETLPPQERVEEQQSLLSESDAEQEPTLPNEKQISDIQQNSGGQQQISSWKEHIPGKMNL